LSKPLEALIAANDAEMEASSDPEKAIVAELNSMPNDTADQVYAILIFLIEAFIALKATREKFLFLYFDFLVFSTLLGYKSLKEGEVRYAAAWASLRALDRDSLSVDILKECKELLELANSGNYRFTESIKTDIRRAHFIEFSHESFFKKD